MKWLSLVSKYTIKRYRGHQTASNSAVTANHLQRQFDVGSKQKTIVADLSYIRVQIKQSLSSLHLFHSDRAKEFANQLLDKCFDRFNI